MKTKNQLHKIIQAGVLMALGAILFKLIPMEIWGSNILFDASAHIISASFVLYVLWFFVDQNKLWRLPFFGLCLGVLFVVSVQRIEVGAHNDIGLLLGFIISLGSIGFVERKSLSGKLEF